MDAGFELVSGGTDNHLMLVDLTNKDITGKDAEQALDQAGITVNKNTVPFETRSPFVTSGIRLGTAALTTRGLQQEHMRTVGGFIVEALEKRQDAQELARIRKNVEHLPASSRCLPGSPLSFVFLGEDFPQNFYDPSG